jgi:NADH-quinone oxidoreductase subunit B
VGLSEELPTLKDFKNALPESVQQRLRYPKIEHFEHPNIITTTADLIFNWARSHSLFPFTYGLACCAIEMLSSGFARFDIARYGWEVFRPTPRQCDLMIVAGTVNEKMAPVLKRLYDQMSEPKWVVSMGACATSGGPFYDGYNVVNGVDKVVPVDVYIPGCPPRPEALFDGLLQLQKKIQKMSYVPSQTGAVDECESTWREPRFEGGRGVEQCFLEPRP